MLRDVIGLDFSRLRNTSPSMKTLLIILGFVIVAGGLGVLLWVRAAPVDPDQVHRDPMIARDPGDAGVLLKPPQSPVWQMSPEELMAALDAAALADPRTERIAGAPESGMVSYLSRTRLWGFKDVTTIRVLPAPEGAGVAVRARALRAGYDWGVNAARVDRWFARVPGGS